MTQTGLRISEAIGLTWQWIEFGQRPRVRVTGQLCRGEARSTKSANGRRDLPLSPAMAQRLWALSVGKDLDAPVFASPRPRAQRPQRRQPRPEPGTQARRPRWVTFHSFRHTCASLLLADGKTIRQVSDWLGHGDPSFTLKRYVHLMDDGLGDAEFFDQLSRSALDTRPDTRRAAAAVAGATAQV